MDKPKLTEAHFACASLALDVPVATVKATREVEAPMGGFLDTGEPTILFERHKFSQATGGRYDNTHPHISRPTPGGYGLLSAQHDRLFEAVKLDRDAALKSTSWGMFQILGANYQQAGFGTLQAFINAMYAGEPEQLDAFIRFVKADRVMHRALKAKQWARFAERYNGPAFKRYKYDTRLAAAYAKYGGT